MRPDRFETFAIDTVRQAGHPLVSKVLTLKEAGEGRQPYGLEVQFTTGTALRWQIIAESAPGDKYDQPEVPVEGEAPMAPLGEVDLAAKPDRVSGEAWLAHLLSAAGSKELASIEEWSKREETKAGHHGMTLRFHSGAKVYVRAV
ncbi:hypothetical protein [Streptomyces sp. MI02-7b]|uniref:hypothetical protein n=1 Tax=Streptomyces sp. MI02-7b TaxID=462941 RepID=UPI0029B398F0|nr:hypothetical protein [Streptomyces sp. MI02-7b]MDX3076685.1 hypothetical protein [Streptomyces sp. MI02-7b]